MGRKQKYKLPENEHYKNTNYYNRVDIFRPIKSNTIHNSLPQSNSANLNAYINETFVSSTNNLTDTSTLNTSINNLNKNVPNVKRNPTKSSIWSTTSSFIDTTKYLNTSRTVEEINDNISSKSSKKRKNILIVALFLLALFALVTICLGVGLTIQKSLSETIDYKNKCYPKCKSNRYCVSSENKTLANASCICKPGYIENVVTKDCEEFLCYSPYYSPYTYLDDKNSLILDSSKIDTQIKPYCCPNQNFLTPSCCGLSSSNNSLTISKRIVGGNAVVQGQFPWIVFVAQMYRSNPNSSLEIVKNCSGSLISDRHVLTAAHCMDLDPNIVFNNEFPNLESIIRIYVGFLDKSQLLDISKNYERKVFKIFKHPDYTRSTLIHDLAVVKLEKPVHRSSTIDYLCLFNFSKDDSIVELLKLYSAGWGSINPIYEYLEYPDVLHYVDAIIFPMKSCHYILPDSIYSNLFNPQTHICAGYSFGKDTCYADSGSPLMIQLNSQWFAYGVVSFGSQPNCAQGPSMYIRVAFYYDWIKSVAV